MAMSTLWPDQVKRGPMVREVQRSGNAGTGRYDAHSGADPDGRIERILCAAGYAGQGRYGSHDSATSPELESAVNDAEFQMKAAEADYENMKATQPEGGSTCNRRWPRPITTFRPPNCRKNAIRRC